MSDTADGTQISQSISDTRQSALAAWLSDRFEQSVVLKPLAGDASFRRYFRCEINAQSLVAMDAPPELEDAKRFVDICERLGQQQIIVPTVIDADYDRGFLLLDDLGDAQFLQVTGAQKQDETSWRYLADTPKSRSYYEAAIDTLLSVQSTQTENLIQYDASFMQQECDLFKDWFAARYLQMPLSNADTELFDRTISQLIQTVQTTPQAFVHRDYHSRNLMWLQENGVNDKAIGVLDFQDALIGPIAYDLVSLLKDCYVELDSALSRHLLQYYFELAKDIWPLNHFDDFCRQIDWMGIQRHIKVLGIFARLKIRDQKPHYLADMPLTFHYLTTTVKKYPELESFSTFLSEKISPMFTEVSAKSS